MVLGHLKWEIGPQYSKKFDFTVGQSVANSIALLWAAINDRPSIVIFLNLEKAFELSSPTEIADELVRKRVSERQ